ncbi:baseplate J/gp47 family protein [Sphingomonas faeni]|uniref:baseplate J/gp47 family protein n=1 Tax=Sphingomonas faeni TaxID=185950 RepID=UPI003345A8AF
MSTRPAIDYTNKDYQSLRRAMLDLARYRIPEWTDHTPSDVGILLVDMFAYMGDIILYYQDRIASEMFPGTAVERRSLVQLLRLIGYELAPPAPARADLLLTFEFPSIAPVATTTIVSGTLFTAAGVGDTTIEFSYLGPTLGIDLRSDQAAPAPAVRPNTERASVRLPVVQAGAEAQIAIGSSTGEPNQLFAIDRAPLLAETLTVEIDEGGNWVRWDRRDSFLYSEDDAGRLLLSPADARDYTLTFDDAGLARIGTGDGQFGRIPPPGSNSVRATFRVGGGAAGNVAAGAIARAKSAIPLLVVVTNPMAASGGTDAEDAASGARLGPAVYRSNRRAVTLDDYEAQALRAGGVAKVKARSRSWNLIEVIVAPEGDTLQPLPEDLRARLLDFFEDKRMAGTLVRILDAERAPIELALAAEVDPRFHADTVRQRVIDAASGYFAFAAVDFGQTLYQGDLYALIEAVPGVVAASITRFARLSTSDTAELPVEDELRRAGLPALDLLPDSIRRALVGRTSPSSRIALGAYEIPVLDRLTTDVRVGALS